MPEDPINVDLSGVPETLLWTLYARASEARRSDALLHDPKAVELVDSINYPFEETFGGPQQVLALRELSFDGQVRDFLRRHPNGTVVALADGLNTQSFRLENGSATWLSVDLPETIEIRQRLMPDTKRRRSIACSALDDDWMDLVDPADGVFITAQGLFMYLHKADVFGLIARCASRFPGAAMMFDSMPWHFTASIRGHTIMNTVMMPGKRKGAGAYEVPPMPFSSTFEHMRKRLIADPNIAEVTFIARHRGRGLALSYGQPLLNPVPYLRSIIPWYALVLFR